MKVKKLIEMLKERNPEAEISFVDCAGSVHELEPSIGWYGGGDGAVDDKKETEVHVFEVGSSERS